LAPFINRALFGYAGPLAVPREILTNSCGLGLPIAAGTRGCDNSTRKIPLLAGQVNEFFAGYYTISRRLRTIRTNRPQVGPPLVPQSGRAQLLDSAFVTVTSCIQYYSELGDAGGTIMSVTFLLAQWYNKYLRSTADQGIPGEQ
jgi:hypothetical protein